MWVSLPSACLVSCCLCTFCVTVKAFTIREKRKKTMPRSTSKSMAVTRLRLLSRPRQDSETKARIYRDRGCVSFLLWHTFAYTLAQRFSELKMLSVSSMWMLMTKKKFERSGISEKLCVQLYIFLSFLCQICGETHLHIHVLLPNSWCLTNALCKKTAMRLVMRILYLYELLRMH